MVARRSKSLGDILIHLEFTKQQNSTWLSEFPHSRGMFPCTKCQICPFVERTDTFRDAKGEGEHKIRDLINCSTSKVVYMITCPCPKIYIGKTKRPLKVRIGEHIRDIKKERERALEGGAKGEKRRTTSSQTLCTSSWQNRRPKSKGHMLYVLKLPERRGDFDRILLQKEKWWIYTLKSLAPIGMNTELNLQPFLSQ